MDKSTMAVSLGRDETILLEIQILLKTEGIRGEVEE